MVDRVHRVCGGALFELACVASWLVAPPLDPVVLDCVQESISRLGATFQIVDDLTDFEWDQARGRNNLLVLWITHRGSVDERRRLESLDSVTPGTSTW